MQINACTLGCEGIVSKRLGSIYGSGRVDHWLKIKNPGLASGQARGRLGRQTAGEGKLNATGDTQMAKAISIISVQA